MFTQTRDAIPGKLEEEFSRPVESIMRCEDFKSNFARRLSNRYISRSPVSSPRQSDTTLKLRPPDNGTPEDSPSNVPEKNELCSQLSKNSIVEQNGEVVKPPGKSPATSSAIRRTEVTALNMEVETLRWQLAQTEANRQMHIALLKQIVTFLNRIKEHIKNQCNEPETKKEALAPRLLPRSFNFADLPRSRSVVHVNKNLEYSLSPPKKIITRKISKSISNVNGFKDYSGIWSQSKLSLAPEADNAQKINEEMSRLITLANTVLGTKLPDLACTCIDNVTDTKTAKLTNNNNKTQPPVSSESTETLNQIDEHTNAFILNTICDSEDLSNDISSNLVEAKEKTINDFVITPSAIPRGLENEFASVHNEHNVISTKIGPDTPTGPPQRCSVDKKNDYNSFNYIEDESGFSSMSSFQEIGIPIISIIPPSPCKEIGFMDDIPNILNESEKWKTDTMELEKQTVKVFWV